MPSSNHHQKERAKKMNASIQHVGTVAEFFQEEGHGVLAIHRDVTTTIRGFARDLVKSDRVRVSESPSQRQ